MNVVLIQVGSSVLISWVIVAIKFEDVETSGKFLGASALGVLHPGSQPFLAASDFLTWKHQSLQPSGLS